MDEDLDKKNKKLQEDPDDFDVKNSIFTQESVVSCTGKGTFIRNKVLSAFVFCPSYSVSPFQTSDMLKKLLENVLCKYSRISVDYLILLL